MPEAARLSHQAPTVTSIPRPPSTGALHGEVAAMHRAIEQRLTSGPFDMAVVPLQLRPLDAMLSRGSRAVGWAVLAGGFAAAARTIATLLV